MLPQLDAPIEASVWQLRGYIGFGDTRIKWVAQLEGDPPWDVVLPEDALFDELQSEWLSAIKLQLIAQTPTGQTIEAFDVEPGWVVWPDGESAYWLDAERRALEAPNGAWSADALAEVPLEVFGDPSAGVEPVRSDDGEEFP